MELFGTGRTENRNKVSLLGGVNPENLGTGKVETGSLIRPTENKFRLSHRERLRGIVFRALPFTVWVSVHSKTETRTDTKLS